MLFFASRINEGEAACVSAGVKAFQHVQYKRPVRISDAFQSSDDFKNDVKTLLIAPAACLYLSKSHALQVPYELWLSAVHLLTSSPEQSCTHASNCVDSFVKAFVFQLTAWAELVAQATNLLVRFGITAYQSAAPEPFALSI